MDGCLVAALYKFVTLDDIAAMKPKIEKVCRENGIFGTLLLAREGINGTVAGPDMGIANLLAFLRSDPRLADLEHKESRDAKNPFYRMKVRLKKEIVTMGVAGIDPGKQVGKYVEAEDWNRLISDPDVVVIDTRNDYEVSIGRFKHAIDPKTVSFRDFPAWFRAQKNLASKTRIAMYCTGGIRCEKSTAFAMAEGFEEVYHLKGGILKYLETVPQEQSLWEGECFVFDQRVSVGHGLKPGPYDLCHACRHPITQADKNSEYYVKGISCPHCHQHMSDEQRQRFAERQRQVELAAERGARHIAADQQAQRSAKKAAFQAHVKRSAGGVKETG